MDSHKLIFILAYILIHVTSLTVAQIVQTLRQHCYENSNYGNNTIYQTNLNSVLNSLSSNATNATNASGFYSFSVGQNANKVNALGLCRGDVEPDNCRTCLDNLGRSLKQYCPIQKEATGWIDNCMLRFSNRSIYGAMETFPYDYAYNINNPPNVVRYNSAVRNLLGTLGGEAAKGGSVIKFATGNITVGEDNLVIFGLAQCTPDLTERECNQCLNVTIDSYLPKCCDAKIGARVLAPSCQIRFENGQFYNLTTQQAGGPPRTPSSPPDANPPQVSMTPPQALSPPQIDVQPPPQLPPSGKGKRNKESLVTLSAITTAVIAIFSL